MEQDPPEQVFQVKGLAPAVKEQEPDPEDLPPHKTILEALDAVAALAGVVDRGAEFPLQVFPVTIQTTINLNTGHVKGITRIRVKIYARGFFDFTHWVISCPNFLIDHYQTYIYSLFHRTCQSLRTPRTWIRLCQQHRSIA